MIEDQKASPLRAQNFTVSGAIAVTKSWFERVVLGLNLCPFAHRPAKSNAVRFVVYGGADEQGLFEKLQLEALNLENTPANELETTLIILPEGYGDFYVYVDLLERVDQWLRKKNWEGVIQVASFHPQYQFAGTELKDRSNLTNRSPLPILHLLREDSLSQIVDAGVDTESIPSRNIEKIQTLSDEEVKILFPYL